MSAEHEVLTPLPFTPPSAELFELLEALERSSQDIMRIAGMPVCLSVHCPSWGILIDAQVGQLLGCGER